jgi:hypothetical protein
MLILELLVRRKQYPEFRRCGRSLTSKGASPSVHGPEGVKGGAANRAVCLGT